MGDYDSKKEELKISRVSYQKATQFVCNLLRIFVTDAKENIKESRARSILDGVF